MSTEYYKVWRENVALDLQKWNLPEVELPLEGIGISCDYSRALFNKEKL